MTILEAMERAKKMARGRAPPMATARHIAIERPAVKRGVREPKMAPLIHLEFKKLTPDWDQCEQYRILIGSGSESAYSPATDAYKMLRTRLWHRIETEQWNSLGITSSGPAEGKSVTSLNLALAMAMEGKRNIFLLDLDLRRPTLCKYLGLAPEKEIGDYLNGDATAEEILTSIEGVANLTLAGGRSSFETSSEMLGGDRLGSLLAYLQELDPNSLTIVDLPPLLSSADAQVVAHRLAATLFVVAEGKTRRDGLPRAADLLKNTTVAGIVLNRSQEAVANYYG